MPRLIRRLIHWLAVERERCCGHPKGNHWGYYKR